jgi:molecular chaperone GrpE
MPDEADRQRPVDAENPATATTEEQEEKVQADVDELAAGLERERDEYLELARRTKADFENYRKRVAGEAGEAERRGRAGIARELLPVLDNLERGLAALEEQADRPQAGDRVPVGTTAPSSFVDGVRLVRDELVAVLERNGVESYEPSGEPFDPHQHEAMMARPAGEEAAGKVVEVLEKGYRLDGQVLRPARVIVGEGG